MLCGFFVHLIYRHLTNFHGHRNTYLCQHFAWRWTIRTTHPLHSFIFLYFSGTELWFGNLTVHNCVVIRTTGQITGHGFHPSLKPPHHNQLECFCQIQEHLLCRNNTKICMPTPRKYVKRYLLHYRTVNIVKAAVKKTQTFTMLNMDKNCFFPLSWHWKAFLPFNVAF